MCFALLILGSGSLFGQVSGTKTIPTDYATIAAFITDINTNGIGAGGVTLNVPSGYTETAPAGGFSITATGTATDPIVIQGTGGAPLPVITASGSHVVGSLHDAIFELIGSDYVTISNLNLQENAANTVTTAASNTMTEFGIALFITSATNGAQNNSFIGNTISLGSTYQNAIGIFSTSSSSSTNTALAATSTAGTNSNNKVYGNTISNVAYGVYFICEPITAAIFETGNDIGGSSAATGNTITFGNNTAGDLGFTRFSGSQIIGINFRNGHGNTTRFNTVTTNAGLTRTIFGYSQNTSASGVTYTTTVSNNTFNLTTVGTTAVSGIDFVSGSSTGTLVASNNSITINQTVSAASSANLTAIRANYTSATSTISTNTININQNTSAGALTSSVLGVNAAGVGTTVNVTNNTINVNQNAPTGTGSYGSGDITFIDANAASGTIHVTGNTLNNSGLNVRTTGTVKGVNQDATVTVLFNVKSNTINVNRTAAGASYFAFTSTSPSEVADTISLNNITFTGITGASTVIAIQSYGGPGAGSAKNINDNTIVVNGSSTSTVTGIGVGYATNSRVRGNNITITSGGSVNGILSNTGAAIMNYLNNTINLTSSGSGSTLSGINIQVGSTGTLNSNVIHIASTAGGTGTPTINGMLLTTGTNTVRNNEFSALTTAAGSGAVAINGINITAGTSHTLSNNKFYNLQNLSSAGIVSGVLVAGGTSTTISNNLISGLTAPNASVADAIKGINITSTSTSSAINVYYNSIYLNATSAGANFGTTGLFHTASATATTAALDMRNNIIINESVQNGTGLTVAYRRSGTSLANYASASNRNLLYAGAPSASNLIFTDGTTPQQTMLGYQGVTVPRDANSFTGEAAFTGSGYGTAGNFFISLTGSSNDFLRPVAGITTQVESGAATISGITTDYTGATRSATPDLGAYEFSGTTPTPVITLNSVTPPTTSQCVAATRLVSVNITTVVGTITGATIGYSVNGVPQTNIVMTNVSGTTWEGTIPAATPANGTIAWGVAATNSVGITGNYIGTSYSDEPLFGATASATASSSTICASSPSVLTAKLNKSGSATIGTATTLTSATSQPTAFCNRWPSYRMQTIFTAAELTAAGLSAGPITSMSYNITTLGDAATNANFVVKVGTTGLTAFTDFVSSAGYTTVYPAATYTHAVGVNVINFSTPYNWDGTSNIVVEVSHDGADALNNSQTYYTATPGNTVVWSTSGNAVGTTSVNRLNVVFTGNAAPAIQTISWSDGVGTVGTTNPLSVSPTTTTTYTATITAAGCSVSPSPTVTVTVNPLPSTPTAANSTQCGTQVPTASVTSTSGLPTPSFKWYDAAVAGTVLQSGTSTTYTTAISATTTFYVSELNTVTGCESARVPVTVTVSTPDAISASASVAAVCENGSVTLTAANTNPTPMQNYTYSWASTAGSGAETPVAGNPVTINPSVAGTYIYTATAVDGGCTTTNTVSVTVNPNPASVVASVNDASICNGEMVNLSVTSITGSPIAPVTIMAQNFDAGLGTWTTTYSGTAPPASGWFAQNAPFSYTTYFTNFATPQGGGFAMTNGDIGGSGLKTRAALISPAFSTVGMTSATLTFQNLYQKWNSGDSLVRLEISADGGTSWATLKDYLPLGSQGVVTSGAQVPANESIVLGAPYLNQSNLKIRYNFVTAWGYYWVIDDVKVTGIPVDPSTYSWTSAPAGFTSSAQNPTGVAPAVNTNYTVTITNSFGCSASGSVAVTVNQPSSSSVTASSCDSYTWTQNGTTYTTSGAYTAVIPNAAGCDSTITLNLTITNSTTATVPVTTCSTYTWPINGQTYTTSGTYTATIPNAANCDSVITLNLTINQPTSATVNHAACQTYTWPINGMTYTTSGVYTATIPNAANCDSVITLNLTIGGPSASSVSVTECSSYTWAQNGMTYTASGAYTDTIANMFGCDSVITLNLTINQPTASTVSVTECSSYTWAQNGMTYTASGMYTDTIPNSVNCDSVITLDLTINMPTSSVFTVSTCSPTYTWAQNGTVYSASGMYNDTILNAAGCDSVVTLNLTITNFVATATDNGDATITASAGTTYQWINCTTNTPIAGATAQTFAATANGTYAVIVSNGTCSDTSNCVNITNVGIKEHTISTISVHPNPTNDVVIVTMDASSAIVEVMDVQGKLVQTTQIKSGDQVDLGAYERGVYTLRIKTESGTSIERIVKN